MTEKTAAEEAAGEEGGEERETTGGGGGGRERASATTLEMPAVWWMVRWNSEMNANCRCWQPDLGVEWRVSAVTNGL